MVGVFDIVCEWKELVIDELVMNEHTLHLNIHWLLCQYMRLPKGCAYASLYMLMLFASDGRVLGTRAA